MTGRVFISYVTEDSAAADWLQAELESAGIQVWRASGDLSPGDDWQAAIRQAISEDTVLFLACFSRAGLARERSYQREELSQAIGQLRLRSPRARWLIPVRFDDCEIPDWDIGAGRTLGSLQYADLFGDRRAAELARLAAAIGQVVGPEPAAAESVAAGPRTPGGRGLAGWLSRAAVITVAVALGTGAIAWAVVTARDGQGPGPGFLAVRGRPWTTAGGGGDALAAGSPVRYAFEVDNPTGGPVRAGVRFEAYWGTRDEPSVNIFSILFTVTVRPGLSAVYSPLTHVPASALPGAYTEQADISDSNHPADHTGQYGTFSVTGRKLLAVPFLAPPAASQPGDPYDGPACVAMVLSSYPGIRHPAVRAVSAFLAGGRPDRGPAAGEELEYALEHFGVPDVAISQISLGGSGVPQAQVTDMAIAVRHGSPVLAFVDGAALPSGGSARRGTTGRWVVVVGLSLSAAGGTEVLVNDPDRAPGPGAVAGQPVAIAAFEQAVADAASLPAAQQEPGHIAGIIVAP